MHCKQKQKQMELKSNTIIPVTSIAMESKVCQNQEEQREAHQTQQKQKHKKVSDIYNEKKQKFVVMLCKGVMILKHGRRGESHQEIIHLTLILLFSSYYY